jgi:hypothetical protein
VVINVAFVNAVNDAVDETTNTSVEAPADSGGGAASDDQTASVDQEFGTTRDNPAPLGSAITGDDWTVTINSVNTADKARSARHPRPARRCSWST